MRLTSRPSASWHDSQLDQGCPPCPSRAQPVQQLFPGYPSFPQRGQPRMAYSPRPPHTRPARSLAVPACHTRTPEPRIHGCCAVWGIRFLYPRAWFRICQRPGGAHHVARRAGEHARQRQAETAGKTPSQSDAPTRAAGCDESPECIVACDHGA